MPLAKGFMGFGFKAFEKTEAHGWKISDSYIRGTLSDAVTGEHGATELPRNRSF